MVTMTSPLSHNRHPGKHCITESCILSKLSNNAEKFLPNDAIGRPVERDAIVTELGSTDSFKKLKGGQREKSIKWIREAAPKLFLIHVHARLTDDDITKLLKRFKKLELTDYKLLVENLWSEDC
ncbi:hypothetical protein HD806DRAFT_506340 [Xylariaceae sp. AK1471]|nr:hypothetical protein HD806DRAFT_506340 [Xylariaceae sp. AK1471]